MPNDTPAYGVTQDNIERAKARFPLKVYTFDFRMDGTLSITARNESDAYRQAIQWSKTRLAEIADLEMDGPEEAGVVQ